MILFYLMPLLPYLLFRFKGSSTAIKLTFITILQVTIFWISTLLGFSFKNEIIFKGAEMIGDIVLILLIINVITIITLTIIKKVNKRVTKDGI